MSLAADGDLVADFRRFPPSVWQLQSDASTKEITSDLAQSADYWTPVREWLVEFTARTGLQDALEIEGYGVWWTLNAQRFVPGLTEVGNAFVWIDLLKAVSQELAPANIVAYGQHEAVTHLLKEIFPPDTLKIVREGRESRQETNRPTRKPLLLLARILLGVVYLMCSPFLGLDVCVLSNTNLMRRAASPSGEQLDDVYLGDVTSCLRQRGWRVCLVEKYGWNASWRGLAARGFFFPSDLLYALSNPVLRKLGVHSNTVRRWRAEWESMRADVRSNLRYRDCDIGPLALHVIRAEFVRDMPSFEALTRLWSRILDLWKPKVIYLNNSYGRAALASIIAAKASGIPTVEQQHGVIGKNHFAYLIPRALDNGNEFPLCDRMAVWGNYTKRFLTAAEVYEPHQLAVCGFPRIDRLLDSLPAREETLAKLGISADAPVVLYTPNKFAQAFTSDILDSIQRTGGSSYTHWVIKLHPAVKTKHTWEAAISQRQLERVQVVDGASDFYALLAACDVHATFASTTLIEAAVLGRPNVGISTPSTTDPAGYSDADAYLPVAPCQLGPVVMRLLEDQEWQASLLRKQRAFADDWCLHDGYAVERIVALLETIATKSLEEKP